MDYTIAYTEDQLEIEELKDEITRLQYKVNNAKDSLDFIAYLVNRSTATTALTKMLLEGRNFEKLKESLL